MRKSILTLAACAALSMVAATSASAAPLGLAKAAGETAQSSPVQSVHWTGYRHNHRWNRGHHRGWGHGRRCWRSCTGIGPLRICKRKCRY